jgi:hypothetical protein
MRKLPLFCGAILVSAGLFMTQCTHDDEVMTPDGLDPTPVERGDDLISFSDDWSFDKTHSSIRWETAYLGTAALLTGRFLGAKNGLGAASAASSRCGVASMVVSRVAALRNLRECMSFWSAGSDVDAASLPQPDASTRGELAAAQE